MKKLFKLLAVSTMVVALLVACGSKPQTGQTTFTSGEDITLFYDGDVVNKVVIEVEEEISTLGLLEDETVEDFYKQYKDGLSPMNVDVDYKVNGDMVKEKITIDMSKATRENVEQIWGTDLFVFGEDGNISYSATEKALKDLGYTVK